MIIVASLIELFRRAKNEGWGYIYGASGETWTQAKQNATTNDMAVKYGQKWVGKRVADCSGLFSWAFKELGGYMYHGSNTMWKSYCTDKGELSGGKRKDGQTLKPGTAVFKCRNTTDFYHVGLFIGDGTVIEAKGTQYGVVTSNVSGWTHWGELKGVSYSGDTTASDEGGNVTVTLLKNGSKGDAVKALQTDLNKIGYDCGAADGIFGSKTEAAVRAFQSAKGLKVDGIVGEATRAALDAALAGVAAPSDPVITPSDTVTGDTVTFTLPLEVAVLLRDLLIDVLGVG